MYRPTDIWFTTRGNELLTDKSATSKLSLITQKKLLLCVRDVNCNSLGPTGAHYFVNCYFGNHNCNFEILLSPQEIEITGTMIQKLAQLVTRKQSNKVNCH